MEKRKRPQTASSLEKALDVLTCFRRDKTSWGISGLARQLGWPKTSVYRLLKTFEKKGFLRQRADSREYELGYRWFELTSLTLGEFEGLRARAVPYLRNLHRATSCTVSLRVVEADNIVILYVIEALHNLRVVFPVGTHLPCNHGASGKLFLAYGALSESVRSLARAGKLKKLTPRTVVEPTRLKRMGRAIRRAGYTVSRGEAIPGAWDIAAPVFDADGRIKAALSLTFPESLSPKGGLEGFIRILKEQAAMLSADLGFAHQRVRSSLRVAPPVVELR